MSETNNVGDKKAPTPAEVQAQQEKITKWYKQQTPHVKAQADYEEAQARISKARYEQALYDVQFAQLMASVQQPKKAPAPAAETTGESKEAAQEQQTEQPIQETAAVTEEAPARRLKTE
jgi:hypothetical protein